MLGDCCLIGLQPVLVHLSKDGKEGYSYHPVSINFLVEVAKTIFAIIVILTYVSTAFNTLLSFDHIKSLCNDALLDSASMAHCYMNMQCHCYDPDKDLIMEPAQYYMNSINIINFLHRAQGGQACPCIDPCARSFGMPTTISRLWCRPVCMPSTTI